MAYFDLEKLIDVHLLRYFKECCDKVYAKKSALTQIASTGSYKDLKDTPSILVKNADEITLKDEDKPLQVEGLSPVVIVEDKQSKVFNLYYKANDFDIASNDEITVLIMELSNNTISGGGGFVDDTGSVNGVKLSLIDKIISGTFNTEELGDLETDRITEEQIDSIFAGTLNMDNVGDYVVDSIPESKITSLVPLG